MNESSDPSSIRPGCVRHASGVEVGVNASVGMNVAVCEAVGGGFVGVGTSGVTGEQAVSTVKSASRDAISVFA